MAYLKVKKSNEKKNKKVTMNNEHKQQFLQQ